MTRFDMKDTFIGYNSPKKVNHFIFECEIFDQKEEIAYLKDIQIELADFEFLSPNITN